MQNGLWHHEIVTMTFPDRDIYEAIGFMNNCAKHCCIQEEMRNFTEVKKSSNGGLYRIEYQIIDQTIRLYSNDKVVERAKFTLRGWNYANRNYNLLTNNCEHFATWCKCGILVSAQVEELEKTFTTVNFGLVLPISLKGAAVTGPFGMALAAGILGAARSVATTSESQDNLRGSSKK